MAARMMKGAGFVESGNIVLDEKPLRFVALPYRSCSAQASSRFSRVRGLLITVFAVALFAWVFKAQAAGDLSRQVPLEVRVQLGDDKGVRRFYTRKVQVNGTDGNPVAEVKGFIREIEVLPKASTEW